MNLPKPSCSQFFALVFFFTCGISAQLTLNFTAKTGSSVQFNGAQKTEDLRIVDDKLYQRKYSAHWDLYSAVFQKQIDGDAIVTGLRGSRNPDSSASTTNRNFYIRHFSPESNVNGLTSFRAMNVGTTNIQGELIEMLDCGVMVSTNPPTPTISAKLGSTIQTNQPPGAPPKTKD